MYTGKVFSYDHNWNDPVIERLAWSTDVLPARSGLEQRLRLRKYPRRSLEYRVFLGGQDELDMRRRYDAWVWHNQDQEMVVPIWTDTDSLSSQATTGDTVVAVNTIGMDYDVGSYVVLWRDYKTYEVVQILSITSTDITLTEPLTSTWPVGTLILPGKLGRMASDINGTSYTNDLNTYIVTFAISPRQPSTNRLIGYSSITHRSYEIVADLPNGADTRLGLTRVVTQLDKGTGLIGYDSIQAGPTGNLGYDRTLFDRNEIGTFLKFLDNRAGRSQPFWISTHENDFEVVSLGPTDGGTRLGLRFKEFGYTANINAADGRRDIVVVTAVTGELRPARIEDAVNNGDGTELVHLNMIGATTPVPSFVSYLRSCRLDQDDIELAWTTTEVVDVKLNIKELFNTP